MRNKRPKFNRVEGLAKTRRRWWKLFAISSFVFVATAAFAIVTSRGMPGEHWAPDSGTTILFVSSVSGVGLAYWAVMLIMDLVDSRADRG